MKNKKLIYVLIFMCIFTCFIPVVNAAELGANTYLYINLLEECSILGPNVTRDLQYVFTGIRIAVPVLLVVLIMKDMVTAVAAGKAEDMKKAQSNAITRIIIGVVIFFVPTIINLLLKAIGIATGTCGIG